jgi:hypothetical protein
MVFIYAHAGTLNDAKRTDLASARIHRHQAPNILK